MKIFWLFITLLTAVAADDNVYTEPEQAALSRNKGVKERPVPRDCHGVMKARLGSRPYCGMTGTLQNPEVLGRSKGITFQHCRDTCMGMFKKCMSFAHTEAGECTLFKKQLQSMGYSPTSDPARTILYNRNCFAVRCNADTPMPDSPEFTLQATRGGMADKKYLTHDEDRGYGLFFTSNFTLASKFTLNKGGVLFEVSSNRPASFSPTAQHSFILVTPQRFVRRNRGKHLKCEISDMRFRCSTAAFQSLGLCNEMLAIGERAQNIQDCGLETNSEASLIDLVAQPSL